MDLLENVAAELGFEFHLYIVRDELFGSTILSEKQKYQDSLLYGSNYWKDYRFLDDCTYYCLLGYIYKF